MLCIEHAKGLAAERQYVLDVVFTSYLGLDYELREHSRPGTRITLIGDESQRELTVEDCLFDIPGDHWLTPQSLPSEPLAPWSPPGWLRGARELPAATPVIYGHPRPSPDDHRDEACSLRLDFDIFGSIFFMLTRYEEVVLPDSRDMHDRFAASSSLARREGFLERPIVDEYVEILWAALKHLWPELRRPKRHYRVVPTHDVDVVSSFLGLPWQRVARATLGDLARRGGASAALRRVRYSTRHSLKHDPLDTFDFLMEESETHGLVSEFYFMTGDGRSARDGRYSVEVPFVRRLLRRIRDRGHVIGLHASYGTSMDSKATRGEFEHLRRVMDELGIHQELWGGRQHYLRFHSPETWRDWDAAGLDYDSTVSYVENAGFRCGTCHEFPTFDLLQRRRLRLRERPLIAMEGSLLDQRYMALSLDAAVERMCELGDSCRGVRGDYVFLWHNSHLASEREKSAYSSFLSRSCAEASVS